jgi:hypothetical protein
LGICHTPKYFLLLGQPLKNAMSVFPGGSADVGLNTTSVTCHACYFTLDWMKITKQYLPMVTDETI